MRLLSYVLCLSLLCIVAKDVSAVPVEPLQNVEITEITVSDASVVDSIDRYAYDLDDDIFDEDADMVEFWLPDEPTPTDIKSPSIVPVHVKQYLGGIAITILCKGLAFKEYMATRSRSFYNGLCTNMWRFYEILV